jgi:hypothetical protein
MITLLDRQRFPKNHVPETLISKLNSSSSSLTVQTSNRNRHTSYPTPAAQTVHQSPLRKHTHPPSNNPLPMDDPSSAVTGVAGLSTWLSGVQTRCTTTFKPSRATMTPFSR